MPHRVGEAVGFSALFGGSIAVAASDSVNMGAVATGIVGVCIALGTGFVYLLKNVGPAWIQYRKERDEMLRDTFAGRMASMEERLSQKKTLNEDQGKLIETLKETADLLSDKVLANQEKAEAAERKAEAAQKKAQEFEAALEHERQKRHDLANKQQADVMQQAEAVLNLKDKVKETRVAVSLNSKAITEVADASGIVTIAPALNVETASDMPTLPPESAA